MKIFVCVKHVPDTAATIKVSKDKGYVNADVKFIANPYDEFGIEAAVTLTEKEGGEVVILTVGPEDAVSTIRGAMAMGAHRAILVKTGTKFLDSALTAKALKAAMEKDGLGDMVFTGKGSVDTESFQTQYRLANALGHPIVNEVCALSFGSGRVRATWESGAGEKQIIEMGTPCVIGATKGLNEPRYPRFPDIMKARKKQIREMRLSDLGIDASQGTVRLKKLEKVPERAGARMMEGSVDDQVTELVRILKEEKVL